MIYFQESIESSLQIIHDISTENIGTLCISKLYSPLKIPIYNTERYDGARQKSDLASVVLQDLGFNRHSGKLDKSNQEFYPALNQQNLGKQFFLYPNQNSSYKPYNINPVMITNDFLLPDMFI